MRPAVILLLGTVLLLWTGQNATAGRYLRLRVDLDKERFAINEPVRGSIRVTSSVPGTFPVIFDIQLFQNNAPYKKYTLNTPVFRGSTEYTFDELGLNALTKGLLVPGPWRLVIQDRGDPPVKAEAGFLIIKDTLSLQ
jgi:hypothetical protein